MTVAFDTLAFAHRPEEAGLDRKISEAVASAVQDAARGQVATKTDVHEAVHTMIVRTGAMIGAAVAILGALISVR